MGRHKQLNKELGDYLNKRTTEKVFKIKPRPKKRKVEDLEEIELEKADEKISKKGFWARLNNKMFGSKAVVQSEPAQIEHEEPPKRGFIKSILYGSQKEKHFEEVHEEPLKIKKVVLYKPKTEQEIRFLIKLVDSLVVQLGSLPGDRFKRTPEYKIFKGIKERY